MSSNNILTLVGFACLLFVRVAAYRVDMIPETMRVSQELQTITFNCATNVGLVGCQFKWIERYGDGGPVLDLSQGSQSETNSSYLTPDIINYSYSGRGLGAGDCGVALEVKGSKTWMVACRVRAGNGGWSYAWADLYADERNPLPNNRIPREAVVLEGGEARFEEKAVEGPVYYCHYYLQTIGFLIFNDGAASPDSKGRHLYLGTGLQNGECGVALSNVEEGDNGRIWSWFATNDNVAARFMVLIVARPPHKPSLSVDYTPLGFTATCEVNGARPVANITWMIGDDVIRQDSLEDALGTSTEAWRWPWMQRSILQTVSLKRLPEYNGKVLRCVVSHVTMTRPLDVTETISFT